MEAAEAPDSAGPRAAGRDDDVLDALAAVIDVLEDSQERVATAQVRARQLREGRSEGASYAELLTAADGPLVLEVVTDLLEGLFAAGSRLRRAEARALYGEGLSMEKISLLLRVSRQRVSALIRATAGGGAAAVDRVPRRSAGLALTGAEYRMVADALPHIVWVANADGAVEYLNRTGTEYFGDPAEAFHGSGWAEHVHPDDREQAKREWREATRTVTAYELEYRILRADGDARWHMGRGLPVRGPDGLVTKWIGTATDIDDQKRLQDELRVAERVASEALAVVEALHAGAPVGFGMLDPELRIVRMNDRLAAMNGAPIEEQLGRPVADVLPALWPHLEEPFAWVRERWQPVVNLAVGGPGRHLASCYPVRIDSQLVGLGLVVVDLSDASLPQQP